MTAPSLQTVKRLFAASGNRCAFDECTQALVVNETVVGDICHIRAASPGGPRFDSSQSEEERASYDNFLLLCPTHHRIVDADPISYSVQTLCQLKQRQKARNVTFEVTEALAQSALLSSDIAIGSIVDSVVSINQQGGITAHTVNQAPQPQVRVLSQSTTFADEWWTTKALIEVVAPYPVANIYLEATSEGIDDFQVLPERSGVFSFGHSGKRTGFCFTNVHQAYGKYTLTIRSKTEKVQLSYDLD